MFKKISYIILMLFIANLFCYSQSMGNAEIMIKNLTSYPVNIRLTPVGTVFSGCYINGGIYKYRYSFKRSKQDLQPYNWNYIVGIVANYSNIASNDYRYVDFDDGAYSNLSPPRIAGGIGYGLWHCQFSYVLPEGGDPQMLDECWIDYRDANYSYDGQAYTNDLGMV